MISISDERMTSVTANPTQIFLEARNFLLENRSDYEKAYRDFRWPTLETFNWAIDWFDFYAKSHPGQDALRVLSSNDAETRITFEELSIRSSQVASFLKKNGIRRGDRVLVMLPNVLPLWEMFLGAMKLGAVLVPTSVQVMVADLSDRSATSLHFLG